MTRRLRLPASTPTIICVCMIVVAGFCPAADYVLLVGGQGAEEPYKTEFVRTLDSIRKRMIEDHGYDAARVRFLAENVEGKYAVDAEPTLANVRKEFAHLESDAKTSDTFLLVMLGHGQSDRVEPKLNLPGPDLLAQETKRMLDALAVRDQRAILVFPCSGHFAQILSSPGRTILASCSGSREIYHSVQAPFLLQAFQGFLADADRNDETTLYELFVFLSQETANFYESNGFLQGEHPSLDDNGDRKTSTLRDGKSSQGDGERAKTVRILPAPGVKRPVEGGRLKVEGGRLKVEGGRWKLEG